MTEHTLMITHSQVGLVAVVSMTGRFDAQSAGAAKKALLEDIDSEILRIVVDLSGVDFMDSSGVGALVFVFRALKERHAEMKFCGLRDKLKTIFTMTKLHTIFDIHPNVEDALAAYPTPLSGQIT
ncbi:STAS domain-containing protein [Desulfovibrio inopinatus]|uniref:STAS domain-containing protein n=1 Tax=Desulfovibrio inopinatus TaxID=102109 RepID=UPI000407925B|nr:STAS domain-containing protein [Desulfovibrio inopinatus]